LPAAEPNEKFFRLLLAVLDYLRTAAGNGAWRAVAYFSLWAVRLSGWLPELHVCLSCGTLLDDPDPSAREGPDPQAPERAYFSRDRAGLMCGHCRKTLGGGGRELSAESRAVAAEMLRTPVTQLSGPVWSQATAADLRRFLVEQIESHVERRLITAPLLESAM